MSAQLKILGVHGLGDHRDTDWMDQWTEAITAGLGDLGHNIDVVPDAFNYDDIFFEHVRLDPEDWLAATQKLLSSWLTTTVGGWFRRGDERANQPRALWDTLSYEVQRTAGYVVAWLEDEDFRVKTRELLAERIEHFKPNIVLAHSLGSLISYDTLRSIPPGTVAGRRLKEITKKLNFVTLGTQLANPFVVGNLSGGRIESLPVKYWYQLFNSDDDVFTDRIHLPGVDNFRRIETTTQPPHDAHSAVGYLSAPQTVRQLWQPLAVETSGGDMFGPTVEAARAGRVPRRAMRSPRKRALLVGINNYANPSMRLEGCANDVFLVSSVLQESGFSAEQMRIVLDDRATAAGIMDRLDWLVDDVRQDDQLVFFYSGHGAQIPAYGPEETVDQLDETLVPYDFDWSLDTSVTDNQIYAFYSQLPYETQLLMVFDCCHSGGIHRDGGVAVRGITAPDDIRHRALAWNRATSSWMPRRVNPLNPKFTDIDADMRAFCGTSGGERRLGRAMSLRQMSKQTYDQDRSGGAIVGPYLPVILQACQEQEYAYEYRAGTQSYGAFTHALADTLRTRPGVSFADLVAATSARISDLGYRQHPTLLGPQSVINAPVPW